MKHRLQLWEAREIHELVGRVLGQQHSGPLRRRKRTVQPQTDEQCGRRACALTATESISGAVKGLVGGAAQGSADCRKNWTTALNLRSSGSGTRPTSTERAEAARVAWGGGRHKAARGARREQGRSKTGIQAQQVSDNNIWIQSFPLWEPDSGGDCFGGLDTVGDRRPARRMSMPAQHAIDFLEEGKGPNHEMVRR